MLDEGGFTTYLGNSLMVALSTVVISESVALLASVAVARFRFRFRTAVLVMVLVVQMVPLEALVIPLFLQAKTLELLNHLFGLVVVYVAFSLPFAIWMLRGFVAAIPVEIEEAAYVDGASWGRMFWSILLPLVAPGLVATSVFSFITAWNEFIFAITFMNDQSQVHGLCRSPAVLHAVLDGLGRRDGRVDDHHACPSCCSSWPCKAARIRPRRRGSEGMTAYHDRPTRPLPGRAGYGTATHRTGCCDVSRAASAASAGSPTTSSTPIRRGRFDAHTVVREGVLVMSDEEGGDVTRLEAATGSSWPGHATLGLSTTRQQLAT